MAAAARTTTAKDQQSRAFWLKHLHQWHWMSAAACLIGLVLFSITGFTLNHATWIGATPTIETVNETLPQAALAELREVALTAGRTSALPPATAEWLADRFSESPGMPEWSEDEVYVSLPRPGGDAWISIDLVNGAAEYERTDRGWLAYFNDLHKGRNTGPAWSLFIDVFAFAALIFAVTGLFLLKMHAAHRPATWPMVGLGLATPLLLALLFVH
jgi:uncharacterized protein